jgi:hypothetical protein
MEVRSSAKKVFGDSIPSRKARVRYSKLSYRRRWPTSRLYVRHRAANVTNLAIRLPATFLPGLTGLGLRCAFLPGCEKI